MINISIEIPQELQKKLDSLQDAGEVLQKVKARSVARLYNRSQETHDPSKGGTPHSEGKWGPEGYPGGNLMRSATPDPANGEFGYTVEYAPFVEFGHRTRSGGYVEGQNYLKNNVDIEKKELETDLKEILKNV